MKRRMGKNTVRHIDKHTDRKERKRKIPFKNEIFPLTINNRSLPGNSVLLTGRVK